MKARNIKYISVCMRTILLYFVTCRTASHQIATPTPLRVFVSMDACLCAALCKNCYKFVKRVISKPRYINTAIHETCAYRENLLIFYITKKLIKFRKNFNRNENINTFPQKIKKNKYFCSSKFHSYPA